MAEDKSAGSEEQMFVRHGGDEWSGFPLKDAFACAAIGVGKAFITQRNFKIHAAFAVLAIILGFALGISQAGWLAIVLCITAVFSLETVNTAIEAIVDMTSPEWNKLAKVAKDCAAGAVLLSAAGSLVIAAIVYIPPIMALLSQAPSA